MGSKWIQTTLGEVIRLQRGHDLPDSSRREGSVPILGSFGVTGQHDEARAKAPGVTIGRSGGSIGVVSFSNVDFWPLNTCLYVTNFRGNDPKFCFYWLKTLDLASFDSGSAQPSLNRNFIYHLPVHLPSPSEQRRISNLLDGLDESIRLKTETSKALEAVARTIFKSWFVDFDPVRAKAEGREPEGMDAATAALFPDEMQDIEGACVPKGWHSDGLGSLCEAMRETVQAQEILPNDNYVGLEHIPRASWALPAWGSGVDLESGKSRFVINDILFGKLRPYFHKVCLAPVEGVCSTDILVIRSEAVWRPFVLCHLSSIAVIEYATRLSNGAKMPRTRWHDLASYKVAVPPSSLAGVFAAIVQPMLDTIMANVKQARTLAELRDALLPRLISGKLRVPEAEKLVEAVL